MQLYHPFTTETRALFIYSQYCWKCSSNGNGKGGLELHHIAGRRKTGVNMASPFNASVLCNECHLHITHSQAEQKALMLYTAKLLKEQAYKPTEYDIIFLLEHCEAEYGLTMPELIKLL